MSGNLRLNGSTSGYSQLSAPAVAGDQTFTFPATGGTLLTGNPNETGDGGSSGSAQVVGYQQGTWNCVLNGSASGNTTITAGQFLWSRIGNQVFIDFQLSGGNKATSGDVNMQGLPYTASPASNQYTGVIGDREGITYGAGYDDIYVRINGSGGTVSQIQVMQKGANIHGQMNNGGGNLGTTVVIRGHISYRTNNTDWTPINGATVS